MQSRGQTHCVPSAYRGALRVAALLVGTLAAVWSAPVGAQVTLERRLQTIDSLHTAGDAFGPSRELSVALASNPQSYALLWRGARDGVMLSLLRDDRDEVNGHLARATALGRRAVAANPTGRDGAYWLAAALARRAQRTGFREAVRFARETHGLAVALLAADSLDAGAHALIGRLQMALLTLPTPVRWVATLGLRTGPLTWASAEGRLQRAVAIEPLSVAYRADLVQCLLGRGQLDRAGREAARLRALRVRTPADTFLLRGIAHQVATAHAAAGKR